MVMSVTAIYRRLYKQTREGDRPCFASAHIDEPQEAADKVTNENVEIPADHQSTVLSIVENRRLITLFDPVRRGFELRMGLRPTH
jgi:type IV secretory pathway ATPase VirB11/archaellum biosynthesis ATPase